MKHTPTDEEKEFIKKAYDFAAHAHAPQKRASGEPYFNHVFATAKNIASFGMDAKTIAGGLLHDVLEDTDANEEEMKKLFGEDVVFLVNGVTKLGTLKYRGRERHVESLRKFFIAMAEDVRVLIIKLADRLHNVQTLDSLRPDKSARIALETIEVHAALANRLGMGKLKGDLEDAAFPYAYPKEYKETIALLKSREHNAEKQLDEVRKRIAKELGAQGLMDVHIDYRVKHTYSLYKKLLKYHMDIEKIYDIVAIRIRTSSLEECYRVLGIIHSLWRPLPGRIKDYIALPKPNGYKSLHTTILTENGGVVEIQIRTDEMHDEAERGIAAHFAYKEDIQEKATRIESKTGWINEMKELQKIIADPEKFLEHLRMDFFKERIFVFTPQGDVVDLPEDAGPLDFAYAIHSAIGNKTASVKINGKMSALNTKLRNGDIVEVMTKKNVNPTSKWLDWTKTTLAKKHIKSYLQENSLMKKFLSFGK
jgi:GTP pyrophosphokinase